PPPALAGREDSRAQQQFRYDVSWGRGPKESDLRRDLSVSPHPVNPILECSARFDFPPARASLSGVEVTGSAASDSGSLFRAGYGFAAGSGFPGPGPAADFSFASRASS